MLARRDGEAASGRFAGAAKRQTGRQNDGRPLARRARKSSTIVGCEAASKEKWGISLFSS
jgi:hypothetical protein